MPEERSVFPCVAQYDIGSEPAEVFVEPAEESSEPAVQPSARITEASVFYGEKRRFLKKEVGVPATGLKRPKTRGRRGESAKHLDLPPPSLEAL